MGSGAMTNSIKEISKSDVIFIIGSNTVEQHPAIASRIIQALHHGAKLIVIDPRRTYLAERAYVHAKPWPGTDIALVNAMAHVIIFDGIYDEVFVKERTEGFNELKESVRYWTPERASKVTGVSPEDIRRAARIYAEADKASILYCMGVTQHVSGTDNVIALSNLTLLTGNVGRPSTGINPLRGQNNVQGACDMGALPNVLSGYQPVERADVREKFSKAWNASIPSILGKTVSEMIRAAEEGDIKVLYIIGENPAVSDPNISHVIHALRNTDFVVVQDIFFTETAQLADVILPAASFAEKDGTFTNTERRVQRVRKAISPVGNAKPDWQIIKEISHRMGYQMNYDHPSQIMDEIANLTPSYGGISYERLNGLGLQTPCPNRNHPGTPYLHRDSFARGQGKLIAVDYTPPAEKIDEEYPMILTTGRVLYQYHTGSMTRKVEFLEQKGGEPFVEINPDDAKALSVKNGQKVVVKSRRGQIKVRARVTENIKKGVVFVPFHYVEAAANALTIDAVDPVAKIPQLKACAVKILVGGGDNVID